MPKPRLFIGSSVEGLPIATALHRNLQHALEVTPWHQGVFVPTRAALDSLLTTLESQDFAAFIFSADDVTTIRGKTSDSVRDNVLFELGLFLGRLGSDRSFFLVPASATDLRIPSDLLGIEPVRYEDDRSDGNWDAATGPSAGLIADAVKRVGARPRTARPEAGEAKEQTKPAESDLSIATASTVEPPVQVTAAYEQQPGSLETEDKPYVVPEWLQALADKKYADALRLLEPAYAAEVSQPEKSKLRAWIGRAKFGIHPPTGEHLLREQIADEPLSGVAYWVLAYSLSDYGKTKEALDVIDDAPAELHFELAHSRASILRRVGRSDEAIVYLRDVCPRSSEPSLYGLLSELLVERESLETARYWLDAGVQRFPADLDLLKAYAKLLYEKLGSKNSAAAVYSEILERFPEDTDALTLRANVYTDWVLLGLALRDYRRAEALSRSKEGWILGNIGNLLNFRGFFDEAVDYLRRAISLDPDSDYAHSRIARALESRTKEHESASKLIRDGRKELIRWREGHPTEPPEPDKPVASVVAPSFPSTP